MKKSFVLMTRSYKYGGFCVAGIDADTGTWLRLVSSSAPSGNEIPKYFFEAFDDLDILEVEGKGMVPCGCQTENFLLDMTVPPVRRGRLSYYELLTKPYLSSSPDLFGNTLSYLTEAEISRQHSSLGLFKVESLRFEYALSDDGKMRYRSRFLYRGAVHAGLSVTDPVYRNDEFAGQTIEQALVVVSLPAIPYPNGKYYKFIAKIFPLTEEEAEFIGARTTQTPETDTYVRNFSAPPEDDAARMANFLQSLAEGKDPDTGGELDPSLVLSPAYAEKFRLAASLLSKPTRSGERSREKGPEKRTYVLREELERMELSDEPVTASALCNMVNALREPYGKNLTAVRVGEFFLAAGMLEKDSEGSKKKSPTALGREHGIGTELRYSANGIGYTIVLYGKAAQQFFVDNIEQCVEVLDAPLTASFGRSWEPWEEREQAELAREYSAGLRLEELAARHKRSVSAIVRRLRRIGFEV